MLPQFVRMIVQPKPLAFAALIDAENLFRQPEPALTSAEYLFAAISRASSCGASVAGRS
jgi:hypothetical protein